MRASWGWLLALVVTAGCSPRTSSVAPPTLPTGRAALLLDPVNAEWKAPAPPVSRLHFETTRGVFVLELVRAWGPIGVDRLYNLARLGASSRNDARTGSLTERPVTRSRPAPSPWR